MSRVEAERAAEAAIAAAAELRLEKPKPQSKEKAADAPWYSERLAAAFTYAAAQHRSQVRKGTTIPYVTHLMGVASLVGEYGGSEDEMIAGLLHDAVEDTGGEPVQREIERRFGDAVAAIVHGCTDDASGGEKAPWLDRKKNYVRRAATEPLGTARVSACDKLHNLRTILTDLRQAGPSVFDRFKAGRTGTLWYYRALADVFVAIAAGTDADDGFRRLAAELDRSVSELEATA
jgi:(p)ppGpp synthase/HD superfamily hydrolase